MNGHRALRLLFILTIALCQVSCNDTQHIQRLEIYDGVYAKIPDDNNTDTPISFEVDLGKDVESGRGKQKKLLERLLPMMAMPFVIQSMVVPIFLGMIKFMLFKSLIIGKLALVLIIINAFRNSNSVKGRDADLAAINYGFSGHENEYTGAYINVNRASLG
ncbi:uncharacterized protein LOC110998742 [Pieris rapae]|uniref:uncharacterized protein LOC110998742 n=1 Tax=Pieris rapae TaxID=64459 RepID=UPI001E27BBC6|nr:uncharacterized protein LOC110998742 [Pieris rapae]